ncbi:glycosyltransferase family 2 protein [Chryseobacterium sp. H3056]|uniref:Glycosyltransferase family 2 protein n=1 Tax=Kaistella daneshvariae TaxID=2487074 RepID=A0A3N0WVX1_9FLAO|nr:glycosyltransferase family 2 protein [Kaistella daneshvariae]ROI09220.1 glycosyltransferase family 2 protein [Kaistella daneshvariae]
MKILTVFTPTYNRAHLLPRLYESLKNQTSKDFVWLIIDDGSTDDTSRLIKTWQARGLVEIEYIFQENQGMSGAHNTAYKNIKTLFNTCIDSDDMMAENAVELIIQNCDGLENLNHVAGIIGLDADFSGTVLGDSMPDHLEFTTLNELHRKYNVTGDKKLVYKTEVMQEIEEYPIYRAEKLVPLSHKYLLADQNFVLKALNEILCLVEYQEDGSSRNMLKQYRRHPRGFAYARITRINLEKDFTHKFRNAVHLVSSSFFTGDFGTWFRSRHTVLVLASVPFGLLLNLYIRFKTKKNS